MYNTSKYCIHNVYIHMYMYMYMTLYIHVYGTLASYIPRPFFAGEKKTAWYNLLAHAQYIP